MRLLTKAELDWLNSRGGRTSDDVLWDEDGDPYVMMRDGANKEDVPVNIPKDLQFNFEKFEYKKYQRIKKYGR